MEITGRVAIVTGAASGIGKAVSEELVNRGVKAIGLVDLNDDVLETAAEINKAHGAEVAYGFRGNTTDNGFRKQVFQSMMEKHGVVSICVPAAGITRDSIAVKLNKTTGKSEIYAEETFKLVLDVNLVAPVYWALQMVAHIAEDRFQRGMKKWLPSEGVQGAAVFIGSISSQGNKGQISYAATKAGLEGAAATLMKEAIFYGVRCGLIHPGFTDTPMVRALGDEYIEKYVLPQTELGRLIRPQEIADAICFMVTNSAVSGELWADAGWSPSP